MKIKMYAAVLSLMSILSMSSLVAMTPESPCGRKFKVVDNAGKEIDDATWNKIYSLSSLKGNISRAALSEQLFLGQLDLLAYAYDVPCDRDIDLIEKLPLADKKVILKWLAALIKAIDTYYLIGKMESQLNDPKVPLTGSEKARYENKLKQARIDREKYRKELDALQSQIPKGFEDMTNDWRLFELDTFFHVFGYDIYKYLYNTTSDKSGLETPESLPKEGYDSTPAKHRNRK